jgi:hypothetical protein
VPKGCEGEEGKKKIKKGGCIGLQEQTTSTVFHDIFIGRGATLANAQAGKALHIFSFFLQRQPTCNGTCSQAHR